MAFTFRVDKPKDLESTLFKIKEIVKKNKGNFEGNIHYGKIALNGVEGAYLVRADCIEITSTKSPNIFNSFIEKGIRNIFHQCSE